MASIGHIAVGMAAARIYRGGQPTRWTVFSSMLLWSIVSMLPDADVIGFRYGIAYADAWGHRGATHSIVFALMGAVLMACVCPLLKLPAARTGSIVGLVLVSHPILDTLTNGGLGCALLWPFSDQRFFAPWNPIPVAPIGKHFVSPRGIAVALAEVVLFAPVLMYSMWPRKAA